ncbi:alpha-2,8-sialyltransferase 8E-like [Diadema antillarum]|uniref:alpha-2,8-sialyltransferase 8E-like n=1 Tax=Diadema antillarum TaxID=105358 RepID=UPI003A874840
MKNALFGCKLARRHLVLFGHSRFAERASSFWAKVGDNKNISAGLYVLTLAISVCEETHLYGFWPFNLSPEGAPVRYHYYDRRRSSSSHNFTAEFAILSELHARGIIKLHTERCA